MAPDFRFLPLALPSTHEYEIYMLPGIGAAIDAFTVGPVRVTRLPYSEWIAVEDRDVFPELQDVYAYGRPPLFCVFGAGDPRLSEESRQAQRDARERLVYRLVQALRLVRGEDFPDPTQYIVYLRTAARSLRDPRVFGRKAYSMAPVVELQIADVADLEKVFHALDTYACFGHCPPLDVAIDLFDASYDAGLFGPRDRILPLLGALEALTDGKEQPLSSIRWPDNAARSFLKTYRRLRNEIAHGGEAGGTRDLLTLRQIIRWLLCEALARELERPRQGRSTGLPLLEAMRESATFGSARLTEVAVSFGNWAPPEQ